MGLSVNRWIRLLFDSSGGQNAYYLIFTVLLLLQLCPIWLTPYPAMHDYPNHLARVHILHEYIGSESYQATYERDWRLIPNLAMDLIVPVFMNIVSIETSSRIFLSLVVLGFNLGLHLLGLAINSGPHWNVLATTFFTYNFALSYGFVNYVFGLGMFFLTLAIWLRFRSEWTLGRIFWVSALAMVCYVSHLSAFVFLGISLGCLTGIHLIKTRSLQVEQAVGLLSLIPPTLAYLWYNLGIEQKSPMVWWHPLLVKKATGFVYPFLSYDLVVDLSLGLVFVLLVLLSLREKESHFVNQELILTAGVFGILYLCAPMSGAQSSYVDRRFLLPAAVFLLLGLRIDVSRTLGRYVLIGLVSLSILRVAEVWHYWNRIGEVVKAQVRMLEHLPDGARLYPMVIHDQSSVRGWLWDMHFFFSAHYATIYRHAFVPTIYAWKGAHPLNLRLPQSDYAQVERNTPFDQVNWNAIFSKYDYLWGYKLPEEFTGFLLSEGELITQSGDAMLFRIRRSPRPLSDHPHCDIPSCQSSAEADS